MNMETKTIPISEQIDVRIAQYGTLIIDTFQDKTVAILPEEIDKLIAALQEAKTL